MKARLTAAVGLTSATMLAIGLLVAPAASADNYAPDLPPATTGQIVNPSTPTPIGPPNSGIVLTSESQAKKAVEVDTPAPATSAKKAPVASAPAGKAVAPVVSDLPAGKSVRVTATIGGQSVDLGKVKVASDGTVVLPAMRGQAGKTITVKMTDPAGKSYFVKVKFAKK